MNDYLFSLDIGTRKIAAFLTRRKDGVVEVAASRIVEHESRAVRSGQIHDIEKVARVVGELRDALQQESGVELKKVATAIAGRNLQCHRAVGELQLTGSHEITKEDVRQAELSAINAALSSVGPDIDDCYFVGHTIVRWEIDGEAITHPLGHYAQALRVELIATFLPRKVLESLFAVMRRAGLEVSYLTLEPIAAVEAVFPHEMRHITMAIVDIGAGTSDIALISNGSIQAFGMLPVAGDFITETVCGDCLVDFNEAERIKREVSERLHAGDQMIRFKDIFGREQERQVFSLMEVIHPAVQELARRIADEIQSMMNSAELSNRSYAVVLVGGGGLTPLLDEKLVELLALPKSRVGVRSPAMTKRYVDPAGQAASYGPHTAVALGLAGLAADSPAVVLMHVAVNDRKIELLNFKGNELTVLSALVAAGASKQKIFGRPGLALTVNVNGEMKIVRGGMPQSAQVLLNDAPAELQQQLAEGDRIRFVPAQDGENASCTVGDILPASEEFFFNGEARSFPFTITINGMPADRSTVLEDHADVTLRRATSLEAVLSSVGVNVQELTEARIKLDVLGQEVERRVKNYRLTCNGAEIVDLAAAAQGAVHPGDRLEFETVKPTLRVGEFAAMPAQGRELRLKINNQDFVLPGICGKILLNGREVDEDAEVSDGDIIRTVAGRDAEAVLVDIFRYISLDPKDSAGKRLKLLVNQEEANFTTPLTYGADVKITFE